VEPHLNISGISQKSYCLLVKFAIKFQNVSVQSLSWCMHVIPVRFLLIILIALSAITLKGQEWVTLEAAGDVEARRDNGFMSCKGKFYLLGGHGRQGVNIFVPSDGTWSQGAVPPIALHHFQATRIEDEIWIVGAFTGEYPNEKPVEYIYIYDTAADEWRKGAQIPQDRLRGSAGVAVYRESLYLIGGTVDLHNRDNTAWVDRYDSKTGKWKKLADAPRSRGHFHAGICNGKIYAAGGSNPTGKAIGSTGEPIAEVDVYDIKSGRWTTLSAEQNLPTPRAACATVTILDHILVIGGESFDQEGAYRTVEAYDTDRGAWEQWDSLESGKCGTQAFMCVGAVFITAGSRDRSGNFALTTLEMLSFY
jgi:Kelch motif protein